MVMEAKQWTVQIYLAGLPLPDRSWWATPG